MNDNEKKDQLLYRHDVLLSLDPYFLRVFFPDARLMIIPNFLPKIWSLLHLHVMHEHMLKVKTTLYVYVLV